MQYVLEAVQYAYDIRTATLARYKDLRRIIIIIIKKSKLVAS
jgi:hypothetical protein